MEFSVRAHTFTLREGLVIGKFILCISAHFSPTIRAGMTPKVRGPYDLWTDDEDAKLRSVVAASLLPYPWARIAEQVPGRDQRQCRSRWINHLDPVLNKAPRSMEEDIELVRLVGIVGTAWSKIAMAIGTRISSQCSSRYNNKVKKTEKKTFWKTRLVVRWREDEAAAATSEAEVPAHGI